MTLVREHIIFHIQFIFAHGRDNLVAFRFVYTRIVGALPDQQRNLDLVGLEQRRLRGEHRFGVAHAFVESGEKGGPIRRNRFQQRVQIRGADDVDAAGKRIGRKGDTGERGVAAVTAAHDADFVRVGDALLHRPIFSVEQIGVHGAGPLQIAGIQIFFAIPGRPAKINLQHGVPAIGQPLRVTIEAPGVAAPRSAVNQHDHGQVMRRFARRSGEIAVNFHAIAGGVLDRFHRGQFVGVEVRPAAEQERRLLHRAIVEVISRRRVVAFKRDHPQIVVERARQVADVARVKFLQEFVIRFYFGIDEVVFHALLHEGHHFQRVALRVGDDALHVELRIGGQNFLGAGGQVNFDQPRGVNVQAGDDAQFFIVRRKTGDGPESLVGSPVDQVAPRRLHVIAHPHDGAAIGSLHLRGANLQRVVRLPTHHVAGILGVHLQLSGFQIQAVDVEQLRIALVHLHQDDVRRFPVVGRDVDAHFVKGGEVLSLFGGDVGLVEAPVFVAAQILRVQNAFVVVVPGEVSNAALGVRGHRAIIGLPQGADPHVEHAIHRRQITEMRAVRRYLRVGAFRVPEQNAARDQFCGGRISLCRGRKMVGEQQDGGKKKRFGNRAIHRSPPVQLVRSEYSHRRQLRARSDFQPEMTGVIRRSHAAWPGFRAVGGTLCWAQDDREREAD